MVADAPTAVPGRFVELTEDRSLAMPVIEQDMLYRRYRVLAELAAGKRVLEIGCGTAMGNDVLSEVADFVASFDLELHSVRSAATSAPGVFGVADAQALPFADGSFDVVAGFEMAYYVPDQSAFVAEVARVLRPGGVLLLVMANPERPAFHRSPHSTEYLTARTAASLLARHGFAPSVAAAFPLSSSPLSRILRAGMRTATALQIVPRTLGGRAVLKRVLQGKLSLYPGARAVEARAASISVPVPVPVNEACRGYNVLYAEGRRPG